MIKILHTSDWHLGRTLHAVSLMADQEYILDQILSELEKDYDALLISGDIYDRAVPSPEAVSLFGRFLKEVHARRICCVIISGNHDSAERLGFAEPLFDEVGIHFRCDYQRITEPIEIRNNRGEAIHVFALPFVETSYIRQMFPDLSIPNNAQAVEAAVERIRCARCKSIPTVLMAHAFVGERAEPSDSEREFLGGAQRVSAAAFSEFDYVALGHLHKPQWVDQPWIRYCGSPLPYSFSEVGTEKQMVSIQFGQSAEPMISTIPLHSYRPISIVSDTFERLLNAPEYAAHSDHYLSVRLTDDRYHINTFGQLKQRFPHLLELRQIALEAQGDFDRVQKPSERMATPADIFDSFLDFFGWQDVESRKIAKTLLQKSYQKVQENQREANP